MNYITKNGIRRVPEFTGEWGLTENQVDVLALHHTNITNTLFKSIDADYRFLLSANSNWIMLGQHFIELLHISDGPAFRSTCASMINAMANTESLENPFVAASIAETNIMPLEEFKKVLQPFLKQNYFGLLPFATGFLRLGDHFSTLWALRMIGLVGLQEEKSKLIDSAIQAIEKSQSDLNQPDFAGFFLFVLLVLNREKDKELIQRFTEFLINSEDWKFVDHNLRSGGFVAYDLLYASEQHPIVMPFVEKWLCDAFSLNEENPRGFPKPFVDSRKNEEYLIPVDVWAQGYIRALVVAGLYLKMRKPAYTLANSFLNTMVVLQNQHSELLDFYNTVSPHLDAYHRLVEMKKDLAIFWDGNKDNFTKSVFVSRWMGKSNKNENVNPIATSIIIAIKEELNDLGLICRYSGDRETNHSDNLYYNNEIYMRGCKHCIAVFEGMPGKSSIQCTTNHNVLIETGFMRGKGSNVLLLHDPLKSSERPSDWSGILYKEFNCEEDNLIQLRVAVRAWGEKIARDLKLHDKSNDDNEKK